MAPPTRRARTSNSSTAAARASQKTLAFGPNASNKITKPVAAAAHEEKKLKKTSLSPRQKKGLENAVVEIESPEEEEESAAATSTITAEKKDDVLPHRQLSSPQSQPQTDNQKPEPPSTIEQSASKITPAQIKLYWKKKEDSRRAPRVHQQDLGLHEKILREFDLSSQFGPCIGIPRSKRWKRANTLNLHPPLEVLAVLLKEEEEEAANSKKGTAMTTGSKMERAYIDRLMGARD